VLTNWAELIAVKIRQREPGHGEAPTSAVGSGPRSTGPGR